MTSSQRIQHGKRMRWGNNFIMEKLDQHNRSQVIKVNIHSLKSSLRGYTLDTGGQTVVLYLFSLLPHILKPQSVHEKKIIR